ncbi:hypothetical protein CWB99_23390 [Pseudoalteromonas rubra]|uniref:Uncharacterized protein n=1 Tax=Pseudoalteromonas rubra TaxID=43658 RepID=A0A5S3WF85_9GAMM|nr:hypothetical protein CWB99_23390 [Pseudoalteromonas rubra]TMP29205.1 hypothetical protein CWC00_19425 [Pseudoalteromonas rubra]
MKKLIAAVILLSLSPKLVFANAHCTMKATAVDINKNGQVYFSFEGYGNSLYACSTSTKSGYISTETCKLMYSTMLAATLSKSDLTLSFDTSESCESLQNKYRNNWKSLQADGFYHFRIRS